MNRLLPIILLGSCLLYSPTRAVAQNPVRPAAHFGTFTKNASLVHCLGFAQEAMKRKGYQMFETGGHVRIGGNGAVIVEVACASTSQGTTAITVSAFSSDSKTAELARNEIREYIVKVVRFD